MLIKIILLIMTVKKILFIYFNRLFLINLEMKIPNIEPDRYINIGNYVIMGNVNENAHSFKSAAFHCC